MNPDIARPLPDATSSPLPAVPVAAAERITVIDCLRGAALFGILVANMRGFNAPLPAYIRPSLMWTWLPDRMAQALGQISNRIRRLLLASLGPHGHPGKEARQELPDFRIDHRAEGTHWQHVTLRCRVEQSRVHR